MADCLFCKIVQKEIPANIVYEDQEFLAFKDINPAAPIHVLLIPKKHYSSLWAVGKDEQELLGRMLVLVPDVAKKAGISEGFRLVVNTGKTAGQTVDHLHLHILGGRDFQWPPG